MFKKSFHTFLYCANILRSSRSFVYTKCLTGNTVGRFFFTACYISLSTDVGSVVPGIPGYFFIFPGTLK